MGCGFVYYGRFSYSKLTARLLTDAITYAVAILKSNSDGKATSTRWMPSTSTPNKVDAINFNSSITSTPNSSITSTPNKVDVINFNSSITSNPNSSITNSISSISIASISI
ncbi:hypothetical protein Dimus_017131 [Dionaea muscipula]